MTEINAVWLYPIILALGALVVAGLLFVARVGEGAFAGLTITANLLTSLAIDPFGWFGMPERPLGAARMVDAALMVCGSTALIALKS
jgi:bacterial/archaeal transporter family-2 protein